MIKVLGMILTVVSVAGLAIILEGATGTARWLKAWTHARPRPLAPPHAKPGDSETETEEEDV